MSVFAEKLQREADLMYYAQNVMELEISIYITFSSVYAGRETQKTRSVEPMATSVVCGGPTFKQYWVLV